MTKGVRGKRRGGISRQIEKRGRKWTARDDRTRKEGMWAFGDIRKGGRYRRGRRRRRLEEGKEREGKVSR